jgi:hypothetical protein
MVDSDRPIIDMRITMIMAWSKAEPKRALWPQMIRPIRSRRLFCSTAKPLACGAPRAVLAHAWPAEKTDFACAFDTHFAP